MLIDVFSDNPLGTNCWLLAGDGDDCVVIDPGFEPDMVRGIIERSGKRLAAVLATHGHFDHIGAAGAVAGSEVPVYVHRADALAFTDHEAWKGGYPTPEPVPGDLRELDDGDGVEFDGFRVTVMHTPGHTPGSSCFLTDAGGIVVSGDLVFAGSIGRFDFPNSDPAGMASSLERFFTLPDGLRIHPGHGPTTSVGRERPGLGFWLEHIRGVSA